MGILLRRFKAFLNSGVSLTILETGSFSNETPWLPNNAPHPVIFWNKQPHGTVRREWLVFFLASREIPRISRNTQISFNFVISMRTREAGLLVPAKQCS